MSNAAERAENGDAWKAQRAIVMQLLRDDRAEHWTVSELRDELADFEPALMEGALGRLAREQVLVRAGSEIRASRAARCLDELELIGI